MRLISSHIVWQIAQRDYKFGKGKHRSLTKATYDAIGDYFRGLWGKEAGWAHSVLFTADLRAFSAQLLSKVEVKEEFVKKEEDITAVSHSYIKIELGTENRLKRTSTDAENKIVSLEERTAAGERKRRRKY